MKKILFTIFTVIIFMEIFIEVIISHPSMLVPLVLKPFYPVYEQKKNVISFEPSCARYDPYLAYTLKPGSCLMSNVEYKNIYHINSLGVRDDEESLTAPDVVVLGDSEAMGLGVDQNETFSQIIERRTGLKVLNTGVSSYGTVREFRMLERVDVSNMKFLVILYTPNDAPENKIFYESGNDINIMSKEKYDRLTKEYLKRKKYFFGRNTKILAWLMTEFIKKRFVDPGYRHDQVKMRNNEAKYFLNVLKHSRVDLRKVKIIVLANDDFLVRLKAELHTNQYPQYIKHIIIPESGYHKREGLVYVLDGHFNAKGHAHMAGIVAPLIESYGE